MGEPKWVIPFQMSAITITLTLSGLLPLQTFLCILLYSIYICLMSKYAFPKHPNAPNSPSFVQGSKYSHILKTYVRTAAYIGLYFPFTYILLGVVLGHKEDVHTAAPHTFLLACQVLSERFFSYSNSLSPPSLALVPILYNSGRLVSIWAWLQRVYTVRSTTWWIFLGRGLALVNLLLWSYNLFGFLLPIYLPFCFRRYFESEKA